MTVFRCESIFPFVTIVALFLSVSAQATVGQPGTLDPTFGTGGLVITPMGSGGSPDSWALALQPDGKVVLAGGCAGAVNTDFCALRYNANGTLDSTFGIGGKLITPVGTGVDQALAIALAPDGRLVLAGVCAGAFCAVRYDPNGSLDATFGIGGKAITQIGSGSDASALAVALQPDGKLVLAGYCMGLVNTEFCALRYDASGTLDTSFGTGGLVVVPVGGGRRSTRSSCITAGWQASSCGYMHWRSR